MNIKEKYDLADMVIEYALKNGAAQATARIDESRSNDIEIRDQKIDSLKESNQNRLSFRLFVDGKYSGHATSRMKKDELLRFVDEAIAATRYLAADEFRKLPDPALYYKGGGPDLKVLDPEIDKMDAKTKIDLARKVHDEAFQKDDRIISVSAYYNDSVTSLVRVASNGFRGDVENSNISLAAQVSLKAGTGRPSDSWYEAALFRDRLITTDIGKKALDRAIKKIGPKKIASGKYPVILENKISHYFASALFNAMVGASLYNKQSFLAGKENKPISSSLLTIYDDPTIISGFGSRLFDEEGLAAVKRPVIEKGILKNYYIDDYYGRKLGMKPTSGSMSNLVYGTGTRSLEEMIASMKKGIFMTGMIGGNCNGTTGDFSYGIDGFLVQDGKIVQPVNEMNINGNMNDFWFSLIETGNDPDPGSAFKAPSLMFENADFSGI